MISGEHADFTRLVVELPAPGDWTVGRTSMGYAFAAGSDAQPAYDLSQLWKRIPKTRLQAVRADPNSGALLLTLACDCHVFPFEYRPGMVVLDIKEGAAPAGSVFEMPFAAVALSGDATDPPAAGPVGYDWTDLALQRDHASDPVGLPLPLATGAVSLDTLRDELLEQISRGAAQGVVDMDLPGKPRDAPPHAGDALPWTRIRIGELPGIAIRDPAAGDGTLPADGEACAADELLALPDWGAGRAPLDLLAEARSGLYGEFDALDPEKALQAVQQHLYLGFGAEARQYLALLMAEGASSERQATLALYQSMTHLVDGDTDPATPFAPMLGCDGPAALWAALAHDRFPEGSRINTDAILRGFLALPAHQRRALGPGLAEKFLAAEDASAARLIRDVVGRIPHIPAAEVALLDASADLQADRAADARAHAELALQEGDRSLDSLILLVEAHLRDMTPLTPDVALAVAAFSRELAPQDHMANTGRTLVLALALSGQTAAAFAALDPLPETGRTATSSDLWRVVVELADDNAFLGHAVGAFETGRPDVSPEGALGVAQRLIGLGFADAALAWLERSDPANPLSRRAAATAELMRGDARAALAWLDGGAALTPEDMALKAKALLQLGAIAEARTAYAAAGLEADADRLRIRAGDWVGLAEVGGPDAPASWVLAAAALEQVPKGDASNHPAKAGPDTVAAADAAPPEIGPLGRGMALLAQSAEARAAIDAVLAGIAAPVP